MEDLQLSQDQKHRVNKGEHARRFLESYEWLELVKPILDEMIKGVSDVRSMKKNEFNTDVKAQALILAHQMTAGYLSEIEIYLKGYIEDARITAQVLEQKKNRESLYKEVTEQ